MSGNIMRQAGRAALAAALALVAGGLACNLPGAQPPTPTPEPPPPAETAAPPEETAEEPAVTEETAETEEPAATEATAEPPAASPMGAGVVCENLSFNLNPSVAAGVVGEVVPAEDAGPEGPYFATYPAHAECLLTGYALSDRFHEPRLYAWPVAEYAAMNPGAAEVIARMGTFLVERPAAPESVPFLPLWGAAQMMQAKVSYLDFQNGTGVRFLTQYGQAANPINNNEMFYTFQGMTDDGVYWLGAVLPVSHPSLPADGMDVPGGDWAAFSETYEVYITGIEATLNGLADDSFTPSLAALDALVRSVMAGP